MSAGRWVAGWNMPGYLPETDPETFDTLEDAVAYLRETAERWADEDEQDSPEILVEPGAGADGYYSGPYGGAVLHLWAEPMLEEVR